MEKTGQSYSSGEWLVQAGSEEDLIERWTTFIECSLNDALVLGLSRSCWYGAPRTLGGSFLWERGRTKGRSKRGERCPRCRSC